MTLVPTTSAQPEIAPALLVPLPELSLPPRVLRSLQHAIGEEECVPIAVGGSCPANHVTSRVDCEPDACGATKRSDFRHSVERRAASQSRANPATNSNEAKLKLVNLSFIVTPPPGC